MRSGQDYVLEQAVKEGKDTYYMTGHGNGVRSHDYIELQEGSDVVHYQVKRIEYYCDPPDMWIALLTRCA